ncbi:hypothetical protein LTR47_006154 [Exophiala xenobiotica]|nr:hypothetical protein LTR47_006154 [Exophiala xenobiotica]KAK5255334.1 hypothetical protein LTS06_000355 [Exophiala xenobiotica]KAK5348560.1 hypothetical protein LTR61_007587 [Exophiala xenobiotica]KAK5366802.1 hypothetical protein LTR11_007970 [Exophiala xenobiotica]KAK5368128.1 hypothetical protein LTS03_008272 [Exophiala xenobiotica]
MRFRLPSSLLPAATAKRASSHDVDTPEASFHERQVTEKEAGVNANSSQVIGEEEKMELQHGVASVEAMTEVWTKRDLIIAYGFIWVIQFMLAFSAGIVWTLTPYVTSSFQLHSLTATTSIISSLIGGLFKIPYAEILDIWGRPQAFLIMIASITLGLVMMAGCNDVKTYCAAQVFFNVGYTGIAFSMSIFVADTSKLRNRAFMIAFTASPYLVTTWVYGPAVESILSTMGFRWGFGIWAIVLPLTCAPLCALFWYKQRKADKLGLIPPRPSRGNAFETFIYYCREFDVIGLLIISTGLALFLLSFSLYSYQKDQRRSPLIICVLIFGGLLIIAFGLYKNYLAPVTFIPWYLLKNRTIVFTYTMAASIYIAWYIWDSYFYSLNIVLFRQSITQATYIGNIYTMGSCFWSFVLGVCIRFNGRIKRYALYFGVPLTILGVGLMIHFRQPGVNIGYIVMCQIFVAFGGGTLVICEQMTVMAVSTHQHISAVLAMEGLVAYVGSSIGVAIAAAMWTGIFPQKLLENLPASAQSEFASYGDLTVQASYPVRSPTRIAIDKSYAETQKLMLIAATSLYTITPVSTALWRDIDVKNMKQRTKGLI